MKRKERILNTIASITGRSKIQEIEQQYETPIKTTIDRPINDEGVDGDRTVVQEFLYIKVGGRWMKTELQEVE
jgi:hypothetical protein